MKKALPKREHAGTQSDKRKGVHRPKPEPTHSVKLPRQNPKQTPKANALKHVNGKGKRKGKGKPGSCSWTKTVVSVPQEWPKIFRTRFGIWVLTKTKMKKGPRQRSDVNWNHLRPATS